MLTASFVDGGTVGPVTDGAACETEDLSPLEAFRVEFRPRGATAPTEADVAAAAEAPVSAATARRGAPVPKAPVRKRK